MSNAPFEIKIFPDRILRQKAKPVGDLNGELVRLVEGMFATMYEARGIGLAAPQVGYGLRVIVFDIEHPEGEKDPHVLVNPVILEAEGEDIMEEGCLSVPGIRAEVKRAARVLVKGYDLDGKEVSIEADGLLARVLQHEVDHLDGILFFDRLSRIRREMIKKKLLRARG